jgi:hypothetical protein
MVFEPNDNAILVCTVDGQSISNPDYTSELEAYRKDREINAIMRQRTSVCG